VFFFEREVSETLRASALKFEKRFDEVQKITQAKGLNSLKGVPRETLMEIWMEAKASVDKK
jgi:uncharacterized protein YabN with tetrapyrrole methylase and pyrophosphatase domain